MTAATSRLEKISAGQKLASGIFSKSCTYAHLETPLQVTETHQENVSYVYNFASGCAVGPNNAAFRADGGIEGGGQLLAGNPVTGALRQQKSVAWVYVSANHTEVSRRDDALLAKNFTDQGAWLKNDMTIDDKNTRLNPFIKNTNYLSDGDRFETFIIGGDVNMKSMQDTLSGFNRVYVGIHGITSGEEQFYYFNGLKVNETGLSKMIPNMTEHYGCEIGGSKTGASFFEKYIPLTRDYLRN